jgi:LacI family transcriptional regulator
MSKTINKRITIKSIANKLDLSPSTISYVLHGKARDKGIPNRTIEKVRNTADEMGYMPNYWAQSLKRQRTRLVTTLLGSLGMNWANQLMIGVNSVLREEGYTSFIAVDWSDGLILKQEINSILKRNDEGVICQPNAALLGTEKSRGYYEFLVENGPPVVFVSNVLESWDISEINVVTWNEKPGIDKAVNYFARTGCEKIAFVGYHHGVISDTSRCNAFKDSVVREGLELREDWIIWAQNVYDDLKGVASSFAYNSKKMSTTFWRGVLEPLFKPGREHPDAILAINDDIGMKIWETLNSMSIRVPDDVSIIGIGNLLNYDMYLTSIVEPITQMGEASADMILDLRKNPAKKVMQKNVESDELVIRQTTRNV